MATGQKFKIGNKGQNVVEYMLVFAAVVVVTVAALAPGGFVTKAVDNSVSMSVDSISCMAKNVCYAELDKNNDKNFDGEVDANEKAKACGWVCGDGCCNPNEDHTSCPQDCDEKTPLRPPVDPCAGIIPGSPVCGNGCCEPTEATDGSCPQDCGAPPVPPLSRDGKWVPTGLGPCSVPCGGGTQDIIFTCVQPAFGGAPCPASAPSVTQACNTQTCDCSSYDVTTPCGPVVPLPATPNFSSASVPCPAGCVGAPVSGDCQNSAWNNIVNKCRTPSLCSVGDCNGDNNLTIDELLLLVEIAKGNATVDQCQAPDLTPSSVVDITYILQAVNEALSGCGKRCPTPCGPNEICYFGKCMCALGCSDTRPLDVTDILTIVNLALTGGDLSTICPKADLNGDNNVTVDEIVTKINQLLNGCPGSACGNGNKDPGEECDDGNTQDGDGCTHDCKLDMCIKTAPVLSNPSCSYETKVILGVPSYITHPEYDINWPASQCPGWSLGIETCFDAATVNCSPSGKNFGVGEPDVTHIKNDLACGKHWYVKAQSWWTWSNPDLFGPWSNTLDLFCSCCGNGTIDAGEDCDNSATPSFPNGQSACSIKGFASGTLKCNSSCQFDTSDCFTCGNGIKEPAEECDDGNTDNDDACDNSCHLGCSPACGSGQVCFKKQCFCGIDCNGDGKFTIDDIKKAVDIVLHNGSVSECPSADVVDDTNGLGLGHADGRLTLNDLTGLVSLAFSGNCFQSICGNGIVEPGEECDDGNSVNDDGCDNNCKKTPCFGQPSTDGYWNKQYTTPDWGPCSKTCDDGSGLLGMATRPYTWVCVPPTCGGQPCPLPAPADGVDTQDCAPTHSCASCGDTTVSTPRCNLLGVGVLGVVSGVSVSVPCNTAPPCSTGIIVGTCQDGSWLGLADTCN